jgi:hypothetical protein
MKEKQEEELFLGLKESYLVVIVGLLIWLFSFRVSVFHTPGHNGDSAFAAQVFHNFRTGLRMETSYYTSVSESIDHVWYKKAPEACAMDLESQFKGNTPWGHHYFIAYLFYPFAQLLSGDTLVVLLHTGIYTSVLVFSYLIARKQKMNVWLSLLFSVAVSQHPLWRWGFDGQFYFNRFFLPLAGFIILCLEEKKKNYWLLLLLCALAFSSNEINGMYLFLLLASYFWVRKTFDLRIASLAAVFFIGSFISTNYIQAHFPLRSTQQGVFGSTFGNGFEFMVKIIKANVFNHKTYMFFFVNFFSLGMFLLLKIRLILPFLLAVLPNLLLSVGGGEKISWETHYHTGYFIPLIWFSAIALGTVTRRPWFQTAFLAMSIVIMGFVEPYSLTMAAKPVIGLKNILGRAQYYSINWKQEIDFRQQLRDAVGESSTISTPETASFHLYDHVMYYYPMGIDTVDVVILKYDATKQGDKRFYSINYGHQDPNLDECIFDRMKKGGFDFENPVFVKDWAVIKRKLP